MIISKPIPKLNSNLMGSAETQFGFQFFFYLLSLTKMQRHCGTYLVGWLVILV